MANTVQRIDTSSFEDVMGKINSSIDAFKISKTNIIDSTNLLLDSWSGKGKTAFNEAFVVLKTELTDEEENLQTIYDDIKAIKESYEGWDLALKGSLSGE